LPRPFLLAVSIGLAVAPGAWATEPRARDLGIPFAGTPGPLDAITDVAGVEVGHRTLIAGEGKRVVGKGPVRTGVTAIFPRGKASDDPVFAATVSWNGNGELTGTAWIRESGFLEGPILWTNTHSVGVVRDAVVAWKLRHGGADASGYPWSLPVVGETWDGELNDIDGFHVTKGDAWAALDGAHGGAVEEGSVGGGTGMVCYELKGGIGTASRKLAAEQGGYTVGVIVQCNCGRRAQLRIAGVDVGSRIPGHLVRSGDSGSILIAIATDAPLLPHQLERLARRAAMGLARTGSVSGNGSGDLFLAFSTANPGAAYPKDGRPAPITALANDRMDPLFSATVEATEEAIVNSMVAAPTMTGADGTTVIGMPRETVREIFRAAPPR
jgi:L-aminopeptidase/D-esterase-like protein